MSHVTLTPEEIAERVLIMMKQEEGSYAYDNYLPSGKVDTCLNITWREKISQWSYNVVDHFDLSREVVAVSLDLFDRYLATRGNECTGTLALLVSLTTLHIAIKLHDSKKIKITTLANLSRGQFGPRDIEDMEWKILAALHWRLHPPTQYSFVSHLLLFLPCEASHSVRKELFELARYLTELAVCDTYFVDVPNSTVAFASILNAMEDVGYSQLSAGLRETFLRDLKHKLGRSCDDPKITAAKNRLRTMFVATATNEAMATALVQSSQKIIQDPETTSLASSTISSGSNKRYSRSCNSSVDSKGSCRYSPSPSRRLVMANPMGGASRSHMSASPIVASVQ